MLWLALDLSLMFFSSFSLAHTHLYSTHQGTQMNALSTLFQHVAERNIYSCLGHEKRADTTSTPGRIASPLHAGCLASHGGDGAAALKSLCFLVPYDSASAALCMHTHVARLLTALSVTWRS